MRKMSWQNFSKSWTYSIRTSWTYLIPQSRTLRKLTWIRGWAVKLYLEEMVLSLGTCLLACRLLRPCISKPSEGLRPIISSSHYLRMVISTLTLLPCKFWTLAWTTLTLNRVDSRPTSTQVAMTWTCTASWFNSPRRPEGLTISTMMSSATMETMAMRITPSDEPIYHR